MPNCKSQKEPSKQKPEYLLKQNKMVKSGEFPMPYPTLGVGGMLFQKEVDIIGILYKSIFGGEMKEFFFWKDKFLISCIKLCITPTNLE